MVDPAGAVITPFGKLGSQLAPFNPTCKGVQLAPLNLSCPPCREAIVNADPPTGTAVDPFEVPKVFARPTATASVLILLGAAATTALTAPDADPVASPRPLVKRVVMGPDELEDRLRDDLLVDEEDGVVHDADGALSRPHTRSVVSLIARLRLPAVIMRLRLPVGQADLTTPVAGKAFPEEENAWRAMRLPRVVATMDVEAAPMR